MAQKIITLASIRGLRVKPAMTWHFNVGTTAAKSVTLNEVKGLKQRFFAAPTASLRMTNTIFATNFVTKSAIVGATLCGRPII